MSGRSVTITIGTTGSIRTTPSVTGNGVTLAGDESKDKMYEPKHSKKMVRVLTVIGYMFSVSLAAIVLSMYYEIVWSPRHLLRLKKIQEYAMQARAMQAHAVLPTPASPIPQPSYEEVKDFCCSQLTNMPTGVDMGFSSSLSHPVNIQISTEVPTLYDRATFNSQEEDVDVVDPDGRNNNVDINVDAGT